MGCTHPSIGQTDATATSPVQSGPMRFIPAGDARFLYEGRLDFSDRNAPVVIWPGSRISIDFEGPQLALRFAQAVGQNFFNAEVDGAITVVTVSAGASRRIELPAVGAGRHRLVVFKRTEASVGHVQFTGVEVAEKATAWPPATPGYKLRMEFFGDSIMVGACNEDGATDQWDDRRTHNNALSYTTLTAAAFAADYRCEAVSGMGVSTGYTEIKAGQEWDRLYPVATAAAAALKSWQPDVLLINWGENDDSFPRTQGHPFPADYTANYVAAIHAIRSAYPRTHIVLLRGGMHGGAQSEPLRQAWEAVVKEAEAGDPAISHFVFTHWSANHPRVSNDRILAGELVTWLKAQPFMQRFL